MSKLYKTRIYEDFINGKYQQNCYCLYDDEIFFDYYVLDYEKIIKIADILENDNFITLLSFHRCSIDNDSAIYLFNKLKYNNTIKTLILHGNKLDESAFIILSELLCINKNITCLCLGSIKIGSSAKHIANIIRNNSTIKELNLSKMNLKTNDFKIIASALKHNTSISSLYLFSNKKFCNNKLNSKYLLKIFHNKTIKLLSLHSCNISTEIIDIIFDQMIDNHTINSLILSYNNITSANINKLCELIKNNKTLENLELDYNKFNDTDGQCILKCLDFNTTLKNIDLKQTNFNRKNMPDIFPRIDDSTLDLFIGHQKMTFL
jgi:hypothetical protein